MEAMDVEIVAIEKKQHLELIELLNGQKTISVKWMYKTKLEENSKVDKYKVRLIAKDYK